MQTVVCIVTFNRSVMAAKVPFDSRTFYGGGLGYITQFRSPH